MMLLYQIVMLEESIEKNEILNKSFQMILTIKMIINNENKKISRNRKSRNERRKRMNDDIKLFLNKIN